MANDVLIGTANLKKQRTIPHEEGPHAGVDIRHTCFTRGIVMPVLPPPQKKSNVK